MRPVFFNLGPLSVRAYGVMLVIAFVVGIAWALREAGRRELPPERMIDAGLAALVGGLIGSRVLYVILDPYLGWRDLPFIWRGGLSFHGGLVGGILLVALYGVAVRVSPALIFDTGAPSMALGYAVARIGCFLNGCCYGGPTHLPWAARFRDPTTAELTPPSHPAQLYAVLGGLATFAILLWLRGRARVHGQLFIAYIGLYGVLRFTVEFWRKGYTSGPEIGGPFTAAQLASIALMAFGIAGWLGLKALGARRHAADG
ncbi:MAG: prolipoprotein diacylglyceryl transferase [Armatimonadota bacterium]|nr:MAG: prolipoprotein diacylglyceryl transferase [Armatimonadota bacterium]